MSLVDRLHRLQAFLWNRKKAVAVLVSFFLVSACIAGFVSSATWTRGLEDFHDSDFPYIELWGTDFMKKVRHVAVEPLYDTSPRPGIHARMVSDHWVLEPNSHPARFGFKIVFSVDSNESFVDLRMRFLHRSEYHGELRTSKSATHPGNHWHLIPYKHFSSWSLHGLERRDHPHRKLVFLYDVKATVGYSSVQTEVHFEPQAELVNYFTLEGWSFWERLKATAKDISFPRISNWLFEGVVVEIVLLVISSPGFFFWRLCEPLLPLPGTQQHFRRD